MRIPHWAVDRPIATTMLLLAAVLLGIVSLARLEVTLLPDVRARELWVWVAYPDAGVLEIEEAVARPVEDSLVSVRGVRSLRSEVVPGGVTVRVDLHDEADPDFVSLGVRERLDALRWTLPAGVSRPLLTGGGIDRPDMVLALGGSDLELTADWAEDVLRPRLEQLDGVARAQILGAPEREVRIEPDPVRMRSFGVGATDIARAFQESSVESSGGVLRRRGVRYALEIDAGVSTAEEVAGLVVARDSDRPLCVRDFAEVSETIAPLLGMSRLDAQPAVGVLVYREAGSNLVDVAGRVHDRLAQMKDEAGSLPVAVISDPSPFIEQSIGGIWQAMWVGGLLAFLVLWVFLREIPSPLILLTALPVSVLSSFCFFDLCNVSLNLMSLGGIALGIGMLVDNGIICLENIHRLRLAGASPQRAAAEGASEIATPILASTLTTCAVFLPLCWVPGPLGALFRDQAISVTVCLFVSLITAVTLLPMLASRFGTTGMATPRMPFFDRYHRLLTWSLRRPVAVLGLVSLVLVLSAWTLGQLPREILPDLATDQMEIVLTLPSGHDVTATDAAVQEIEAWFAAREETAHLFVAIGAAGELDLSQRQRLHRATLRLQIHPRFTERRETLLRDFQQAFADRGDWDLRFAPARPELESILPPGDATLVFEVTGPNNERAEEVTAAIHREAIRLLEEGGSEGPSEIPLRLGRAELEPRYRLVFDESRMWREGVSPEDLSSSIRARASGLEVGRLRRFDKEIPVVLRLQETAHPGTGWLAASDRSFPARELIDVRTELAPASVVRVDQSRIASISWDGPLRGVGEIRQALEEAAFSVGLPEGYRFRFAGTYRDLRETMSALLRAFALSAGLVLLILAAQFESVRLPWIIFAAVPLALVGVVVSLLAMSGTVNVLSGIGLVVLIGIVVNDSILKVDLLENLRAAGTSRLRAVLIASRQRYRPILMTTLTTTMALAPLFWGEGSELRVPLATTLIGGLISATALTLIVIPLLFDSLASGDRR